MVRRLASKLPPNNSKAKKRNVADDDDYFDDDTVADSQSQAREMQMFEKKIREIKRPKPAQSHVRKFGERVKSQEDAVMRDLELQLKNVIDSSKNTSDLISTTFAAVSNWPTLENHPLRKSQDSLFSFANELITIHHPLQESIKDMVEHELQVPEDEWKQNIDDADAALGMMKDEGLNTVDTLLSESGGSNDSQHHHWGQATKKSSKGIRKALRIIPIPTDVGNQFDIRA